MNESMRRGDYYKEYYLFHSGGAIAQAEWALKHPPQRLIAGPIASRDGLWDGVASDEHVLRIGTTYPEGVYLAGYNDIAFPLIQPKNVDWLHYYLRREYMWKEENSGGALLADPGEEKCGWCGSSTEGGKVGCAVCYRQVCQAYHGALLERLSAGAHDSEWERESVKRFVDAQRPVEPPAPLKVCISCNTQPVAADPCVRICNDCVAVSARRARPVVVP